MIGLLPPRESLYARIDRRFIGMIERGAIEEARRFGALGLNAALPANRALGLPELRRHIAGEIGLDEAIGLAQQASRNYAKRQMTWFRHQMPKMTSNALTHNSHACFAELSERNFPEIISFILPPA